MQIHKMTACFGKLNNETLEFHGGLNIVAAPNESGKSTYCAFLRAMLYGIDNSERERAGYKPDKLKYAPWNGAPMAGELLLTHAGADITLRRAAGKNGAPMREFSAVYTDTGVPVPGWNGDNVGEALTGVSRDVFERSAYIAQAGLSIGGSAELERRIASIVSTGEETGSYSEAEARLKAWQRRRHFRPYGEIPALEAELADLEAAQERAGLELADLDAVLARTERVRREIGLLKRRVEDSRRLQRQQVLEKSRRARLGCEAGREALESANRSLSAAEAELAAAGFGGENPAALRAQVEADICRAEELAEAGKKLKGSAIFAAAALLALFIAALALGFLLTPYCFIPAALFLGAAALIFWLSRRAKRRAGAELEALLARYGVSAVPDIGEKFCAYNAAYAGVTEARQAAAAAAAELERRQERQRDLEARLLQELDFSAGDSEAAVLGRRLTAAQAELGALRERRALLEGKLGALGDPLVVRTEMLDKQARREALVAEYDAIELALLTLRDADNELQTRFSPLLARKAGAYLSRLTLGHYGELSVAKDFSMLLRESGGLNMRETAFLSAGTVDQVYLSLRLAICDLALPEAEPCPLILDDALVNFDSARAVAALELLGEIAQKRQVILFACE